MWYALPPSGIVRSAATKLALDNVTAIFNYLSKVIYI